jgi:xanthine dehydrogenase molybdopterin-binding subunit B
MMVTEQIMDQVAHAVGKPVEEIKRLNMYNVSWLVQCGVIG